MFDLIKNWDFITFYLYLGILLFLAKIIKEKVPFIKKIIIPTALIAGFIGLLLSDGFLGVVDLSQPVYEVYEGELNDIDDNETDSVLFVPFEEVLKMGINLSETEYEEGDQIVLVESDKTKRLDIIFDSVYHALAIGFIAMTLKKNQKIKQSRFWSTGMTIMATYLIQSVIGITVVIVFFKEIFIGSGMLLALGFGQGHGLATGQGNNYAIGAANLIEGGALGATIASVGYLVGGIIGVIILNYLVKKYKINIGDKNKNIEHNEMIHEAKTFKEIGVFDSLTAHIVIIFIIYIFVYLTLIALENYILPNFGEIGAVFSGVFHGFNFLIGVLYALIFKKILSALEKKGKKTYLLLDNYVLSNISGVAFNFMIVASVLTITNVAVKEYYILVLVLAFFGTIATYLFLKWISKIIHNDEYEHHFFLVLFGTLTGTLSTGLALLKGIDHDYKTPVSKEIIGGTGAVFPLILPFFALLAFPVLALTTGNNLYIILIYIISVVYFIILVGLILLVNRTKNK